MSMPDLAAFAYYLQYIAVPAVMGVRVSAVRRRTQQTSVEKASEKSGAFFFFAECRKCRLRDSEVSLAIATKDVRHFDQRKALILMRTAPALLRMNRCVPTCSGIE